MKQKTTLFILAYLLSIPMMYGQFVVKPTYFEATGVSNQGNVVGYEAQAGPYSIWNPDSATVLNIDGLAPGLGIGSQARYSDDGNYISGTSRSAVGFEMARYDVAGNSWQTLGGFGFPLDSNISGGFNISGDGNTVVGNSWADTTGGFVYTHAVAWNSTEGFMDLGSLFANIGRSTRGNAVSGDGSIVVGWQDFNGPWKSAVWRKNPAGGYFPNEYLLIDTNGNPNDEFNQLGECSAVSSDGNWIGGYGDYANNNEPWIWSRATGVINLGVLPNAGAGNVAGINSDGTIVVGWFNGQFFGDPQIPFIWTPTGGLQNLNSYISNDLGYSTGPVVVYSAFCLSENGEYLAGYGVDTVNFTYQTYRLHNVPFTGINETNASAKVVSYPNPSSSMITIENKNKSTLIVSSADGRIIESLNIKGDYVLDISKYAAGSYQFTLRSGDAVSNGRFIKN
ncbi:MAG: T9SS type A sorting domain-containing protein [Bacteroidia bacterium]|nr:T9SS type A sorting domain-containing protein [Bacteroidia bacterium]